MVYIGAGLGWGFFGGRAGEGRWCSGERSPPTNVCHMWVEVVVSSLPCFKDFPQVLGFFSFHKTNKGNLVI